MSLNINIQKRLKHFELCTDFSCCAGELTAIVGPSGSGKTTLIRLIAGLERPDFGTISLNGRTWTDTAAGCHLPTRNRRVGLVFQDYTLFPHMTVRRNIAFGAPEQDRIDKLMDAFGILHLAEERPGSISGGERQRTAMCQALASQPELLLLDEPFSALDTGTRAFLCSVLTDLKRDLNIPILHVTHDLGEARLLGDKVVAVERGRIAHDWFDRQIQFPAFDATPATQAYPQRTVS